MIPSDERLAERIAAISLFAELDGPERAELAAAMREARCAAGEALMTQGARPDGAFFILDGRRSATVRATAPVEALFLDRRYFRAALAQLRPGALKVLRRLAAIQSERLRLLHGRIGEAARGEERAWATPALSPGRAEVAPVGFEPERFLPVLPCFRGFDAADIEAVRVRAELVGAPRGSLLCEAGDAPEQCYMVVRGAVASGFLEAGRMHQLNVLGPGRFCALGPLIESLPMSVSYLVRESALLLKLTRPRFMELFLGADQTALMLLSAVNEHQAAMVARASNHLTRLVGLSRLSRQLGGGAGMSL